MARVQIVLEPSKFRPWLEEQNRAQPRHAYVPFSAMTDMRTFRSGQRVINHNNELVGLVIAPTVAYSHGVWVECNKQIFCWEKFFCEEVPNEGSSD